MSSFDVHSLSQLHGMLTLPDSCERKKTLLEILVMGNIGTTCQGLPFSMPLRNSLYLLCFSSLYSNGNFSAEIGGTIKSVVS